MLLNPKGSGPFGFGLADEIVNDWKQTLRCGSEFGRGLGHCCVATDTEYVWNQFKADEQTARARAADC